MNSKQNEKIEMVLNNVIHYKDFEEFEKYNNLNKEEFKEMMEDGYLQEITIGTYNGATNTFISNVINNKHIISAIKTAVIESDFFNFFEDRFIKENNIKNYSDWILLYTEFYEVFTLGNSIYAMDK